MMVSLAIDRPTAAVPGPVEIIQADIIPADIIKEFDFMSLSSAKNYALRAAKAQDQKEAVELLSKAILELASSIETTDAKIKKINKGA